MQVYLAIGRGCQGGIGIPEGNEDMPRKSFTDL
jgi:hypothetical protein